MSIHGMSDGWFGFGGCVVQVFSSTGRVISLQVNLAGCSQPTLSIWPPQKKHNLQIQHGVNFSDVMFECSWIQLSPFLRGMISWWFETPNQTYQKKRNTPCYTSMYLEGVMKHHETSIKPGAFKGSILSTTQLITSQNFPQTWNGKKWEKTAEKTCLLCTNQFLPWRWKWNMT